MYTHSSHYEWIAGKEAQILFTFSTNIFLTTITLHYYSDSVRGLPRLRFYAVPDDHNIWSILTTSTPHVDTVSVAPDDNPAGHRNISINVMNKFNKTKVLMYKFKDITFALSEVEFFKCSKQKTYICI